MLSLVELGWRQFTFFEKHTVYDPEKPTEKFCGLKNLKAYCSASGDGFTLFGERCGVIFKLSRNLEEYFWIAHKVSLSGLALAAGNILATVGEDEEGVNSVVKIWQLDRIERDAPFCVRVIRVCPLLGTGRCSPACAVALHSSLQHIAVGFADSSVVYHCGNVLKDRPSKWLVVVSGSNHSGQHDEVTGLALAFISSTNTCVLYSVTGASVKSFAISNKAVTNTVSHDAKGCLRDCWSFSERHNRLIVGSAEMVYFYEAEQSVAPDPDGGKGKCHALGRSNEKVQLIAFDNYVALLTRQLAAIPSADDACTCVISIYDVEGQCVAFSCALPAVSRVFLLDSVLMVLSQDGTLAALTEKPINVKLDVLFKKNLFDLAVGMSKRSAACSGYLPEIYKKYGDYLYKSGDFENSIQQYMETVGYLEPSYVIKKFLDGSRIKELCSYLEMLHAKGSASAQHTTILLNCYTKMAARDKIDSFIEQNLECDVDVAVQVLRAAGFTAEACRLCAKHGLHGPMLSILIEERGECPAALKYISKLDAKLVENYLEKYGKLLLEKCPAETMDLLVKLVNADGGDQIDAARLMKMFVGDVTHCSRFVEVALKADDCNSRLRDIMLELRLRQWLHRTEESPVLEEAVLSLIGDNDLEQALQLCQMFDFAPGIIHIYSKLERYDELIEYHMRQNNFKEIIQLCELKDSQKLWIDAIVFASREENVDPDAIKSLLKKVEERNCVHPLVVLEILSRSERFSVAHVKDYIVNWLEQHNLKILNDEKTIEKNEKKMAEVEEQIENINYKVQIFQMNKCSACDTSLQLPAVHFLCKHSYHVHCLESYTEKADRCPACSRVDNNRSQRIHDSFNSRGSYKQFQDEVNGCVDCMDLVCSYISNGLFDASVKEECKSARGTGDAGRSAGGDSSQKPLDDASDSTPSSRRTVPTPRSHGDSTNPFVVGSRESRSNPFEEPSSVSSSKNPFGDGF